jgi:Tol biopolymer transport system component
LDGELSFSPDGRKVYFHSLRPTNTGYQQEPPVNDFLDIYVADLVAGLPGRGRNLGPPLNSPYPDGEHAIHPDGVSLYFTSSRPGGLGQSDIWVSVWNGIAWSPPLNLGEPVNSPVNDMQPTFTSDGNTMYFASDRNPSIGMAIYRSKRVGASWSQPELVISGMAGEPSITADGTYLYFVHVLQDADGVFDADVWVSQRSR